MTAAAGRVDFGLILPQVGFTYPELVERALRIEAHGIDSLWVFDHLWAPALPGAPSFEGWTLATALATATTRLRVGHLVLCNSFRHPALLAKMATTLDVISGGRLDFGIGSGSYRPEHEQAGLRWGSPAERAERLGEALEVITRSFGPGPATFIGRHYQVRDLPNLPAPVQRPHPPIFVGGVGVRTTLPVVARYADVWNVPTYALDRIDETAAALARACDDVGRDPASVRRSLEAVLVVGADDAAVAQQLQRAERRYGSGGFGLHAGGLIGTPAQVVERIAHFVERGFSHFTFFTADRAGEATLELLASEVMPRFH